MEGVSDGEACHRVRLLLAVRHGHAREVDDREGPRPVDQEVDDEYSLLQDVLDRRPRASARGRYLRLRHAVGSVPQDAPVTHVLSHMVTPFFSMMRSSLPHPGDCHARMSLASLDADGA